MLARATPTGEEVFNRLFHTTPLLFESIAREYTSIGAPKIWSNSTDPYERILGAAIEYVLGETVLLKDLEPRFMYECQFPPQHDFIGLSKVLYLVHSVDLNMRGRRFFYDSWIKFTSNLEMHTSHLYHYMPDTLLLQLIKHLHQPYRIFAFIAAMNNTIFNERCQNPLLIALLTDNITTLDKVILTDYLAENSSKIASLLSAEELTTFNISIKSTLTAIRVYCSHKEKPRADQTIYKNFSGLDISDNSLVEALGNNLSGSNFRASTIVGNSFELVNLSGANFASSSIAYDSKQEYLEFPHDLIIESDIDGTFANSNLTGAIFIYATIGNVNFSESCLDFADFRYAKFADFKSQTVSMAAASSMQGASFKSVEIYSARCFDGLSVKNLDMKDLKFRLHGVKALSLKQCSEESFIEELLKFYATNEYEMLQFIAKYYLEYEDYNYVLHDLFQKLLSKDDPFFSEYETKMQEKQRLEDIRQSYFYAALSACFRINRYDFKTLMLFRGVTKNFKQVVDNHMHNFPHQVLRFCMSFVSTSKLNAVAQYCQSANIIDRWAQTPNSAVTRLFGKLMQHRQGMNVDFTECLPREINFQMGLPEFDFNQFHMLAYLAETISVDCPGTAIPAALINFIYDQSYWQLADEAVRNINKPPILFRMFECIDAAYQGMIHGLTVYALAPRDDDHPPLGEAEADRLNALVLLVLLFTPVTWNGHSNGLLYNHFDMNRKVYLKRYGEEIFNALNNALQVGASRYAHKQLGYYINGIGAELSSDALCNLIGINLRDATITENQLSDPYFRLSWLKRARLIDVSGKYTHRIFIINCNMSLAHMSDKRVNRATFTGTDLRGARITDLVDKPEIEMEKTVVDSRFSITYAQVPSPIPIQENHALAARVGFFGWIRNRRRHMADAEYRGLFGRRK